MPPDHRALEGRGRRVDNRQGRGLLFGDRGRASCAARSDGEPRIDGRDTRTVRPIEIRTGVLPRTHGSALFTRGETQALVIGTLGTARDAQIIDALAGEFDRPLHAPLQHAAVRHRRDGPLRQPEAPRDRPRPVSPSGRCSPACCRARKVPVHDARGVGDHRINGSSSMASVRRLPALMDAGVPMKAHVAGIAMGLIEEGNRFAVLTDILGDEDHLGDMDFKVAGTDRRRDRAADGHQDPGHHQGDHGGRGSRRRRRPAAHPRQMQEAIGARGDVAVRTAPVHDEDQSGEDPRRDRQGRRDRSAR